jgi:hypothetical protein
MSYDDGLFDLRQVEAITNDLRMLCRDLADRLHLSDPAGALDFADRIESRKISADTFVELFREDIIHRLNPAVKTRTVLADAPLRKSH